MYSTFPNYISKSLFVILIIYLIDKTLGISETTVCSPGFYFDTTVIDCQACLINTSKNPTGFGCSCSSGFITNYDPNSPSNSMTCNPCSAVIIINLFRLANITFF